MNFFETLYSGATGYLTIWTKPSQRTEWFNTDNLTAAQNRAIELSFQGQTVYFGVGLGSAPKTKGRLTADEITCIPGLWFDMDIKSAAHKQTALPDYDQAISIINQFPLEPSIIVHSGHGLHAYYLFKEPWQFESAQEREQAKSLLERFQRTIQNYGIQQGFKLDSTLDLSRVLRPPGTMNYKDDLPPADVRILTETPARYNVDDFEGILPDTVTRITEKRPSKFKRNPSDGPCQTVFDNCVFARRFLSGDMYPEPEWTAAGTNLARCSDGPEIMHQLIKKALGDKYSETMTDDKIQHYLNDMHPQTCEYIQKSLLFTGCPAEGCGVKSPCGFALKKPKKPRKSDDWQPMEKFTDLGNAERFVRLFGTELKYCHQFGNWLIWDGTRHRMDDSSQVMAYARKTIRSLYDDLPDLPPDIRDTAYKHARKSESHGSLTAMVKLAQHMLPVSVDELDADKWLLNVRNGVVDLKTGQLLKPDHSRYLTKTAPVNYDPKADCPRFKQFLTEVFPDSPDVIPFLQRLAGYCLTGETSEQKMAIAWGNGANGKSTLLNIFKEILGDYGKTAPPETFMAKRNEGIPNDVAMLRGARFVLTSETQEGRRLNEVLVKQATGGDPMTARFLRQEFFEFIPQFKIILLTNHKPIARGDDAALWRRILLVPFTQKFEGSKRDNSLPEKLRSEIPGILNWMVQGCLEWQRQGLNPPPEVVNATNEYQNENDLISNWIEDCCITAENVTSTSKILTAKTSDLYQNFMIWAQKNGEKLFTSQKKFSSSLQVKGFELFKGAGGTRKVRGLALLDTEHAEGSELDGSRAGGVYEEPF